MKTQKGDAYHVKTDVFKGTMWYAYRGESELFPLTPERAKEIIESNKNGKKPSDLKDYQIKETVIVEEVGYSNVVGQDSVSRFEKTFKKPKKKNFRRKKQPNQKKD